ALRQTAQEVEERIEHRGSEADSARDEPGSPARGGKLDDAVVIYISDDPSTAMLIRRGKRVADVLHARCFAVFVAPDGRLRGLPEATREAVERHLSFARNMHIETSLLAGTERAEILVDFARNHSARQIFLPRCAGKGFDRLLGRSLVNEVVSLAHDIEVTIVADRKREKDAARK
ncbi:MAG: histidine kinase, partial [Bryobacteraceae bacterium]